jgi:menaquinone-dependent protoporphyrinogen oxidase
MSRILILYSTTDGHTPRICAHLERALVTRGDEVRVTALAAQSGIELAPFDKIVIGASIRYGKHQPAVAAFMQQHQQVLQAKPCAFFTVNIVARKPNKNRPDTNPYLVKFLRQITWKPRLLGVFAGKLDYPRYTFFDRQMIRFIMLITHGPTDPTAVVEFTDWRSVDDFAQQLALLE